MRGRDLGASGGDASGGARVARVKVPAPDGVASTLMNSHWYQHMHTEQGRFRNPFDKGLVKNFMERCLPAYVLANGDGGNGSGAADGTSAPKKLRTRISGGGTDHVAYTQVSDSAALVSITQQRDLHLDTSDPASKQVLGAMLGVFGPIVIVLCIPVLDAIVYPLYKKRFGKMPTQFGRVLFGLALATIGTFWAGIFEILRRNSGPLVGPDGGDIIDKGSKQLMNVMYWVGAIRNYVFIALAECLINVTAYDVFYTSVPLSLKSTSQAVNLLMVCMGSIMTSVFTIVFRPYLPSDDLNEGHLEYMFFTVGSVGLVSMVAFVVVMKKMNFGMGSLGLDTDGNGDENDDDADGQSRDLWINKSSISSHESVASVK